MALVEGPDLQAVDVEVLPCGERLVAKGSAPVRGATEQFGVQPQTKVPAAEKRPEHDGISMELRNKAVHYGPTCKRSIIDCTDLAFFKCVTRGQSH